MTRRATWLIFTFCLASGAALAGDKIARFPEVWRSAGVEYDDTDSLAACRKADGAVEVFATAKEDNRIDIFDGSTGAFLRSLGGGEPSADVGRFAYPNGVVVVDFPAGKAGKKQTRTALLVIERDNARVQAFWTDGDSHAGIFGVGELNRPYGGAIDYSTGAIRLYVTDTEIPGDKTVKVYELTIRNDQIKARLVATFGETTGPGAVVEAESIALDERQKRVLLCDEHKSQRNVKVYTLDGKFTGLTFGGDEIVREPEGIVVLDEPAPGVVILTDQQKELSVWHIYDRTNYKHLAAFTGEPLIANTDGICTILGDVGEHDGGLFLAVHDDADVRAYSLKDILKLASREQSRP